LEVADRKRFRNTLLIEVYEHYHSSGGEKLVVKFAQSDVERLLAYKYLHLKKYIEIAYNRLQPDEFQVDALLLIDGIDKIER
jgi:hypothetical protein